MIYNDKKIMICNGYPSIYLPSHSRAYSAGWVYVHILQAEKLLNRPLNKLEAVHHEDENRMNFDLSNLVVFASDADHVAYHNGVERVLLDNGTYYCPSKGIKINNVYYKRCKCGGLCYIGSKMCRHCSNKLVHDDLEKDRDKIKDLIRHNSFVKCGELLGCTDNGVKKKCQHLGLPSSRKEIKYISDEDWELI